VRVERIGVVGAGTMGAGIAQLGALGGFETFLHDPIPEALERGKANLRAALDKGAERGRWTAAEAEAAAARLVVAPRLEDLSGCDLVIEAAPEDLELKRRLFVEFERTCGPEAILATNTSSLRVSEIAAGTERPQRVCGMHFFNPPALMRLVEVVCGAATDEEAAEAVTRVAEAMGRTPVRAADAPGFIANRCARPFSLEALRLYGEGISEPVQIDRIVRIGGGYRMGPFELTDLVGVDVNFEVAKSFYEQSGHEPRWEPHEIQGRMVGEGRLGRKAGRGYYEYGDGPHRADDPPPLEATVELDETVAVDGIQWEAIPSLAEATVVELALEEGAEKWALSRAGERFAPMGKHVECVTGNAPGLVLGRILSQLVNEAHFAVEEGVGTPEDVDTAMRLGLNHPRGAFEWCEAIGAARIIGILDGLAANVSPERYRAAESLRARAAERG
jgi:3-hydroxybutyryl-CoA dehydrogenase